MKIFKQLYDWVLSWSESRWGWVALFLFALFEASWFPLPPDILLIALCLGATKKSFRFAAICLLGSVIGAVLAYGIGFFLWQNTAGEYTAIAHFFFNHVFSEESFANIQRLYDKYNFWIVYTAGFTPLPFKLFTVSAGVFNIDFLMFTLASAVARSMRFFLIAWLIWKFGAPIKSFIDKYFNLLATLLTVMLVGFTMLAFYLIGDSGAATESVVPAIEEVAPAEVPAADTMVPESDTLALCDVTDL
ncbi:MAG: VTT domain-containing protein [Alistipes sp.]|nr:VTT domain-containing protein [Alistipes sp.]